MTGYSNIQYRMLLYPVIGDWIQQHPILDEAEQEHSPAPTDFGKPAMAAPKEYHYVK